MAGEFCWERLNGGFPFYRYRNRYARALLYVGGGACHFSSLGPMMLLLYCIDRHSRAVL